MIESKQIQVDTSCIQAITTFEQIKTFNAKECKESLFKVLSNLCNLENQTKLISSAKLAFFADINNTYVSKLYEGGYMCSINSQKECLKCFLQQKNKLNAIGVTNICYLQINEFWFITDKVTVERILLLDDICIPILRNMYNKPKYMLVARENVSQTKWDSLQQRIEV